MPEPLKDLLIVDDDPDILEDLSEFLDDAGISCETTVSPHKALDLCFANPYKGAIVDLQMPGMNGLELIEKIREQNQTSMEFIIYSGCFTDISRKKAIELGCFATLAKPCDMEILLKMVQSAIGEK